MLPRFETMRTACGWLARPRLWNGRPFSGRHRLRDLSRGEMRRRNHSPPARMAYPKPLPCGLLHAARRLRKHQDKSERGHVEYSVGYHPAATEYLASRNVMHARAFELSTRPLAIGLVGSLHCAGKTPHLPDV